MSESVLIPHSSFSKKVIVMSQENNKQNLNIDITPDVAEGVYSNLAIISHSPTEMILDFAQMLPGLGKPFVRSRVLMAPSHAKRLLAALRDNIEKYEDQFGTITEPSQQSATTVPYDMNMVGKA